MLIHQCHFANELIYDLHCQWSLFPAAASCKVLTVPLCTWQTFYVVVSKLICAIHLKFLIQSGCQLITLGH